MKARIYGYQVVFDTNSRDEVKFGIPVITEDIEAERTKAIMRHNGLGKKVVGINLKYELLNV